jgi:hypothetical protein
MSKAEIMQRSTCSRYTALRYLDLSFRKVPEKPWSLDNVHQYGVMMPPVNSDGSNGPRASPSRPTRSGFSIFTIPRPIKLLFNKFPLVTYPANELPQRSLTAKKGRGHALFLWTAHEDASAGVASFNPNCLKWQVSSGMPCSMHCATLTHV